VAGAHLRSFDHWYSLSLRLTFFIGAVVALAVLAAGTAYTLLAPAQYQSTGAVVLSPAPGNGGNVPDLLGGFERSGTIGSFVELIASDDLVRRAGNPPVDVGVRALPETRVIRVTTEGGKDVVAPALTALLITAQRDQATLRSLWDLNVLESASPPQRAGSPASYMLAATFILAVLAWLFVFVLLRRGVPALTEALSADRRPPIALTDDLDDERPVSLRRRAVG